jgi:hypothetical protein
LDVVVGIVGFLRDLCFYVVSGYFSQITAYSVWVGFSYRVDSGKGVLGNSRFDTGNG